MLTLTSHDSVVAAQRSPASTRNCGGISLGRLVLLGSLMAFWTLPAEAWADDPAPSVGFVGNVVPILSEKCLRCHDAQRQEGDFRIDVQDQLSERVVGGSLEESLLWTEHLAEDASNPMPPEDENDPLSERQLVTIRQWIESGAQFEAIEDWRAAKPSEQRVAEAADVASVLWILAGRLHPALLHFPVALLSVAALFAVFAFGNKSMDKAAMYCLFLGTVGACAAAVSGWGFAEHKNWPPLPDETLGSPQSMHRWGGIAVAGLGLIVFALAYITRLNPDRSQWMWKLGVVVVAGMVGFVGHLGGKLTHDDLYTKPLERLRTLLFESPQPDATLEEPDPDGPAEKAVPATSDTPTGSSDTPTGSTDTPIGSTDSPTGSTESPAGSTEAQVGETGAEAAKESSADKLPN
jgi:uncharacterized membrane protein